MSSDGQACADCVASIERAHWGFRAECTGCAARSVSRGQNFFDSDRRGVQTRRYRDELALLGVTHEQVKAARAADFAAKERAA
jgi:hypothetical protein